MQVPRGAVKMKIGAAFLCEEGSGQERGEESQKNRFHSNQDPHRGQRFVPLFDAGERFGKSVFTCSTVITAKGVNWLHETAVRPAMAIPLVRIVTKFAPVVLDAFELYRRRREAKETAASAARDGRGPEEIQKRFRELEDSDVEQARLINELSTTVEALATSVEREIEDGKKREARLRQLVWIAFGVAGGTAAIAVWLAVR